MKKPTKPMNKKLKLFEVVEKSPDEAKPSNVLIFPRKIKRRLSLFSAAYNQEENVVENVIPFPERSHD